MAWTDERVEQLKTLWAEGLSAAQIANKMGGVTRNAVIGKVHRLGLSGRATPAKPQRGRSMAPEKKDETVERKAPQPEMKSVIPEPEFIEPLVLATGDRSTVATIKNNMCKWPVGDPAKDDFHFCGQPHYPENLIAPIMRIWRFNHRSDAQKPGNRAASLQARPSDAPPVKRHCLSKRFKEKPA